MKKIVRIAFMSIAALSLVFVASCGSKKSTKTVYEPGPTPDGEVEVSLPCTGPQFFSTDKVFRGTASGESLDQMTARKKALSNARAQMATDINSVMQVVGDNYIKSSEVNNKEEVLERFEQNSRTIVNQKLRGVRQICEKATKVKETGKYKYYVAIELSGAELVDAYNETLSKDESLKTDYNYEKFKKTFDKEMDNFTNGR
ncbi:MAG: LPP20 family lipoprotein [Flavobacteriales bacterium]|nr:LPP20 family lipoprotein [Flavobacteriales bacterium]